MSPVVVLLLGFAGLSMAGYGIGVFLNCAPPYHAAVGVFLILCGGFIFFVAAQMDKQVHVPATHAEQP